MITLNPYTDQVKSWQTALLSLYAAQSTLKTVYETMGSKSWYTRLSSSEQARVVAIIQEVYASIGPFGDMLNEGITLMKAGKPPDVLPPPYKMSATWTLPSNDSILIAIWGILEPLVILLLDKLDVDGNDVVKMVMFGVLLDMDNLVNALTNLIEV